MDNIKTFKELHSYEDFHLLKSVDDFDILVSLNNNSKIDKSMNKRGGLRKLRTKGTKIKKVLMKKRSDAREVFGIVFMKGP